MHDDDLRHAGNIWHYQDARGVAHVGHLEHVSDFGGSDITYRFRACADGTVSMVSGQRLKGAGPTDSHGCEVRERLLRERA